MSSRSCFCPYTMLPYRSYVLYAIPSSCRALCIYSYNLTVSIHTALLYPFIQLYCIHSYSSTVSIHTAFPWVIWQKILNHFLRIFSAKISSALHFISCCLACENFAKNLELSFHGHFLLKFSTRSTSEDMP